MQFSGRIKRCQRLDPGSISGRSIFLKFNKIINTINLIVLFMLSYQAYSELNSFILQKIILS